MKRRESAGHDVNVHAPSTIPKAAALNEKAHALCDEELFLQRCIQHAAIKLEGHRSLDYSVGERNCACRVRHIFHGSKHVLAWRKRCSERLDEQRTDI